ncbi:MAG: nucleotidyltransferase domain-containing protein [Deltaproteobacteria bacterium]|nr:nucleotidyltransferase domain-containing protein [Deltaproteobacteria bacterium]
MLAEAVRRIREQFVPAQIILVGSRSRGTARADSDFDLMVIREDAGNWRTPGQILAALRDLPAAFDVQVESTAEWDKWSQFEPAFEFEVAKTGRRLLHG